uniref:Phosphodiesterase n=1 Tax=Tieghemostelium lacteum TaxID=361077 RepID=L7WIJ8_TIELA|nr:cAMP phosphodiesterase [Tieghemostelium lacteum]
MNNKNEYINYENNSKDKKQVLNSNTVLANIETISNNTTTIIMNGNNKAPNANNSTPTPTSTSSSSTSSSPLSTSSNIEFQFEYSPSRVHILVADDDVIQRKILENVLKKFHYNVHNGEEAWECLEKGQVKYDLVLTDVMMPEINGFDLCTKINLHPVFNKIPVILMSGTAVDYKCANDTIKIGGQDFLTKPIAKELLKKKIDTLLGSIWQKKKEMEYKSVLAQEREKGSLLAKQMKLKEHEIEELTRKITEISSISKEAMETPLVSVSRNIEELLQQSDWYKNEDELKSKLTQVLKELGSSNIYRPSFDKLIKNDSIDQATKSFLVTEFSNSTNRRYSIPTFPQAPPNKDAKEFIKAWDFDIFKYSEDDLMPFLVDMFENFQLLTIFKIPIEKLQRFIMAVHSLYRKSNRYHNFIHAFDVTQTCYSFLTSFNAAQYLTHLDILSLLISCMCHDLNHPGFNNAFQVNSQSELSMTYNDVSVLENHHAMLTFKILKNSECNILEGLNEDQYKELRRSVVQLILATDMANHFEHISKFQHHLNSSEFDRNKKEDRQQILNFLIKCGDISNVARPWELNFEWSIRVSDEFFQQSQYEKVCGFPVAPFMNKTQTTRARIAADFIDFVALQLYQALAQFLVESKILLDIMSKNRQNWQAIIELQKEGKYKDDLYFIKEPTLMVQNQKLAKINECDVPLTPQTSK